MLPAGSEPCLGALLSSHGGDQQSEAYWTIPTEDNLGVFGICLWKAALCLSTLTLGLTPDPRKSLHVFEWY